MDSSSSSFSPYVLLFNALSQIPTLHYLVAFSIISITFLYNFLGFHFLEDVFFKYQGTPITYNPSSPICNGILSNCKVLHSRFLATPWLSSPHLQTSFLQFFGRSPVFSYRRQLFYTSDGGTIALDWLMNSDVSGGAFHINGAFLPMNNAISQDETTPIVVVVPGLASDSTSNYLKNLAFNMAKHGWNVVVCNHRGLGGVSITSDCFYNAGWTEDIRAVTKYLHDEYPKAPLFAIGTSIGANILVKYLGEEGERTPVAGAAAVCNPWDLLIGDRFICRGLLQRIYDKALTIGLQGYAQLHEPLYTRLANWEGIKKACSIREFDNYATCHVGKFETVDTYYRHCSSAAYVGNISVPLLCINALDDPVCTREAIPWDECRGNPNIVLATPQHGGHLAFFEGLTATGFWWIRAVDEFLGVLRSSRYMHVQKKQTSGQHSVLDSSIDRYPHLHVAEDGIIAAVGSDEKRDGIEDIKKLQMISEGKTSEMLSNAEQEKHFTEAKSDFVSKTAQTSEEAVNNQDAEQEKHFTEAKSYFVSKTAQTSEEAVNNQDAEQEKHFTEAKCDFVSKTAQTSEEAVNNQDAEEKHFTEAKCDFVSKTAQTSEEAVNNQDAEQKKHFTEAKSDFVSKTAQTLEEAVNNQDAKSPEKASNTQVQDAKSPEKASNIQVQDAKSPDITVPVRRFINQISQQKSIPMWLLAFIAITIRTSWPLVGSAFNFIFRKRSRKIMPAA